MNEMYDSCLREEYFPINWTRVDVVVLLRFPDKMRFNPGLYRPISPLSYLGKDFERLTMNRIERRMCGRMHDCQFGFRKGLSMV